MVLSLESELIWKSLIYYAEEMKIALRNAAFSPNIRERMDHSCAIFDKEGELIAQAKAIPVHLGSMVVTLQEVLQRIDTFKKNDEIILNDPYAGGTHLPDITLISPIIVHDKPIAFLLNRAHHSDIGGKSPGSLAGDSKEIFEEGIRIPPVKIKNHGTLQEDILKLILQNTRTPKMRKGDILAQIAANQTGKKRFKELLNKYGQNQFQDAVNEVKAYCENRMKKKISQYPVGVYKAVDYLDGVNDQPLPLAVKIKIMENSIHFDFSQSAEEVNAPLNAPYGVTLASVLFVIKAIFDPTAPSNAGTYQPITLKVPKGSILNATPPAAVVGGNVETSQRIVDVLLKATAKFAPKKVCAACQGTMNNIAIGGQNRKDPFTFYETVGGGFGARNRKDGVDGVHSHMTNTMNTPIEEIEKRYPLRVTAYSFREDSCGSGKWRGGLGIKRKIKALVPVRYTLLGERQKIAPYGLFGGGKGEKGKYLLHKKDGTEIALKSKEIGELNVNEELVICTPGGGGYGNPKERKRENIEKDIRNEKISKKNAKKEFSLNSLS